jgi:hypothetical protein
MDYSDYRWRGHRTIRSQKGRAIFTPDGYVAFVIAAANASRREFDEVVQERNRLENLNGATGLVARFNQFERIS